MTGFGVGEALLHAPGGTVTPSGTAKVTVEVRAVNHRFLDVRVRVPSRVPDLASHVENLARERLTRGRFDIAVRFDGASIGTPVIDRERARSVFLALAELRDELAPGVDVPMSLLGFVPDLFAAPLEREGSGLAAAVTTAFDAALASLDEMRTREGAAIADDFARRLVTIRRWRDAIAARAPEVVVGYTKRLKKRAERLRAASDVDIDAARLEQEIALFADRIDISEELTRLECHAAHFETLLQGREAVGRRLDFLLQEMAREANTIGAKSQDVEIAHAVVELKAEIENMREQSQNVE
jgi:uncharacterized protein (TIGR00255 family)